LNPYSFESSIRKSPEDTLKFKLLSTTSKPKNSPTHEVVVNVFHNGTPEEYIKAIIAVEKVCKEGSKYFPLHKTNGLDAKECKVLLAQVKKMLASYETKTSFHSNKRQTMDYINQNLNRCLAIW
jgi:hypothetical protein